MTAEYSGDMNYGAIDTAPILGISVVPLEAKPVKKLRRVEGPDGKKHFVIVVEDDGKPDRSGGRRSYEQDGQPFRGLGRWTSDAPDTNNDPKTDD